MVLLGVFVHLSASQERRGELGWASQERFAMKNEWREKVGKSSGSGISP